MPPERNRGQLRTLRVLRRERGSTLSRSSKKGAARVGSSRDGLTGSWEDALEKDGVTVHPAYSQYSSGVVTAIMNDRLTRYTHSARSTEARKGYGDRRRPGSSKKKTLVAAAVPGEEEGNLQVVDAFTGVEDDFESPVFEEVGEVAAPKTVKATKTRSLAVEHAVVENMDAPVLNDVGGEAAQARKEKRQAIAVLAERASVEEVGAPFGAFAGGEVKRSRRDRNALDAR